MTRMITQLLDLTRARLGGGLPIEPKSIDLRDLCRNVVDEFEAKVQLDDEGDLTGSWDEDRLAEVLSNLAGNAIEHAAPGTVVNIKGYADAAEVVVEVNNQGDPIPAAVLPFIFEPFRRANGRQKSPTGNPARRRGRQRLAAQRRREHGGRPRPRIRRRALLCSTEDRPSCSSGPRSSQAASRHSIASWAPPMRNACGMRREVPRVDLHPWAQRSSGAPWSGTAD